MTSDSNHSSFYVLRSSFFIPLRGGFLVGLFWLVGCSKETPTVTTPAERIVVEEPPRIAFEEIAAESGVVFTPRNGREAGHFAILESLGTGVGVLDFDQDGRPDLFFPGGGEFGPGPSIRGLSGKLFRNLGEWKFDDVTVPARLTDDSLYSHGAAVGDFDNDGFPDLLITGYGGLRLFRNSGDGSFEETAEAAGLHNSLWSSSAAWGDLNRDGVPDLYVVNYVDWSFTKHPFCGQMSDRRDVCSPSEFDGLPDRLFFGNGDGTFRDVSQESGLVKSGKGLGVVIGDVDLDGDQDIYVGNDTTPNFLYLNDGTGKLTESGIPSGTALGSNARADGTMGVDLGDFNNDGLPDIWAANFENQSFALYRNEGGGVFLHSSDQLGISAIKGIHVGFGTFFGDFDLDGDEDLFVANGHVMYYPSNSAIRQRPLLLENLNGRRVRNIAASSGPYFTSEHLGRGAAVADFDDDGRPDIVVVHTNEPVALLRNKSAIGEKRWSLSIRLIGRHSARDAIGTVVRFRPPNAQPVRLLRGGGSYLSSNETTIRFTWDKPESQMKLDVYWPHIANSTGTLSESLTPGKWIQIEGDHWAKYWRPSHKESDDGLSNTTN